MPVPTVIAASWLNAALPAFFGFAGVVAGAVLTPCMNRRLDNRRDLEQAGTAWKLLRADAASALRAVQERQDRQKWPMNWNRDWSSVWRSSRGALARRVANEDRFKCVAEVFERMDSLESAMNARRANERRHLSEPDKAFLRDIAVRLRRAQEALAADLDDRNFSPVERAAEAGYADGMDNLGPLLKDSDPDARQ